MGMSENADISHAAEWAASTLELLADTFPDEPMTRAEAYREAAEKFRDLIRDFTSN